MLLFLLIFTCQFYGQVRVPFQPRTSYHSPDKQVYHVKGDFTMIGNTNLVLQNYGNTTQNGYNTMIYADVDSPALTGLGGTPTFNSSTATLQYSTQNGAIPECSNVVFAGLYWTGRAHQVGTSPNTFTVQKNGVTKHFDKQKIQLKGPNSSAYTEFTASPNNIYYPVLTDDFMYSAYVEVTDYVQSNGIGQYSVADIALSEGDGGGTGYYGGWGLVVVYENSKLRYRDITIFDGHAYVAASQASYDIPVSGFNTAQTGSVGVKLGLIAGEGDSGISGDYFKIQKLNSAAFQDLSHSLNTTSNFFNSSITTGGNQRNPNLLNNTGLDISMFDIPNPNNSVIGNNQTNTKFRYGSSGDTYIIFAAALAVDAYIPEVEGVIAVESINGVSANAPFTAEPNQSIKFKIKVKNRGSEPINNASIKIPIPFNTTYIPSTATTTINFTPFTGANSVQETPEYLIWNIGNLPVDSSPDTVLAEMTFELKVTDNCVLLSASNCANTISITGAISGLGATTNVPIVAVPLIRGYTSGGLCAGVSIGGPISIAINSAAFVNQNCGSAQIHNFSFCQLGSTLPISHLATSFPAGTTFYNSFPIILGQTIQYTETNPFPITPIPVTFYAVPPGSSGCFYPFSISTSSVTTTPIPQNVSYWVNSTAIPLTATATNQQNNLYYFATQNASAQNSITPATAVTGQFTYYVAEGPSQQCIGPLVPLIVTVYATTEIVAPSNASHFGCGINIAMQLPYTEIPTTITLSQFQNAGGSLPAANFSCDINLSYVDSKTGNCPIIITRTFSISDNCGLAVQLQQQITINNNVAPTFHALPPAQTIACGANIEFADAIATDYCNGILQATFIDTTSEGSCEGNYSITRVWTAIGSCGNIATTSQTINVADTQSPVITIAAQNFAIQCGANISNELTIWLDNHGGASAIDGCSDVAWSHNFDASLSNCAEPIPVTFTATDACGNSVTTTASIVIHDNIAPIPPSAPAIITVNCASLVPQPHQLAAIDNCQGEIIAMSEDVITAGSCESEFSIVRTWTFTDACGNAAIVSQTIYVINSDELVFNESLPSNSTYQCGEAPPAPTLTATSSCGDILEVSFEENTTIGVCPTLSEITRTWTAVDSCGKSVSHVQTISLIDTIGPIVTTPFDDTISTTCSQIPSVPDLQFEDSCGSVASTSFAEVTANQQSNMYDIVRTWTVTDTCQNQSVFTQTISVTESVQSSSVDAYAACNSDISLSIDLLALLPSGTNVDGQFIDINNSGAITGTTFIPNGLDKGEYLIFYETNAGDCPSLVEITITVDDDCMVIPACSLLVHNAITPNNDGLNDVFYIENIDNTFCFPNNKVEIYNRWGTMVYETTQYNNADRSFKGISEGKVTVNKSDELPSGTYFYILQYTNSAGNLIKKDGYLYLTR